MLWKSCVLENMSVSLIVQCEPHVFHTPLVISEDPFLQKFFQFTVVIKHTLSIRNIRYEKILKKNSGFLFEFEL